MTADSVITVLFCVAAGLAILALVACILALRWLYKAQRIFWECERYVARQWDRKNRERL